MAEEQYNNEYEFDEDSSSDWSDEEIERTIIIYFIFFLLLAFVSYLIVLRPRTKQNQRLRDDNLQQISSPQIQIADQRNINSSSQQQNDEIMSGMGSKGVINRHLVDGIYTFSYLRMKRRLSLLKKTTEGDFSRLEPTVEDKKKLEVYDKKEDEAHKIILSSKLVTGGCVDSITSDASGITSDEDISSPPRSDLLPFKRGGIVVISVRPSDLYCPTSKSKNTFKFIDAVGTISSLFLIVDFSPETNTNKDTLFDISDSFHGKMDQVDKIRNHIREVGGISIYVLPSHRIVVCQSAAGRIAFVRQISPDFVIDFDIKVQQNLHRFGFKTQLYGGARLKIQIEETENKEDITKSGEQMKLLAIDSIGDFI